MRGCIGARSRRGRPGERRRQEERRREKEVAKRRVAALCAGSVAVRRHLEENVRIFNGTPGKPRSFDLLDDLLDRVGRDEPLLDQDGLERGSCGHRLHPGIADPPRGVA